MSTKRCLWGSWRFCLRLLAMCWACPHSLLARSQVITGHAPALSFHPGFGVSLTPWQNGGQLHMTSGTPGKPLLAKYHPSPPNLAVCCLIFHR